MQSQLATTRAQEGEREGMEEGTGRKDEQARGGAL